MPMMAIIAFVELQEHAIIAITCFVFATSDVLGQVWLQRTVQRPFYSSPAPLDELKSDCCSDKRTFVFLLRSSQQY